ncbi:unnamed protein product [Adineta steineri]|uniref:Uncharacterized protein n=2 Tax=Adineta steineri TaxID=433720 RepID=A0A813UK00_9BILA|nr:unnamed protein product [Adineta steineri]CAF4106348.1 unnamed protein product [Adineta steineri]
MSRQAKSDIREYAKLLYPNQCDIKRYILHNTNQSSSSMNFLVLADSHGKNLGPRNTAAYNMVVHTVLGFSWFNNYERRLCGSTLLASMPFRPSLFQASTILY